MNFLVGVDVLIVVEKFQILARVRHLQIRIWILEESNFLIIFVWHIIYVFIFSKILGRQPKTQHSKNDQKMKLGAGLNRIMPIGPETIDATIRFSSIGGLDEHIHCLKEMILMPMMYPDVFKQFQIQPPRGVLFHGPPGTGKTLIARALANECSIGLKKVSFFMRKGADLLSKWIGESEKQLRLLFEQVSELVVNITWLSNTYVNCYLFVLCNTDLIDWS